MIAVDTIEIERRPAPRVASRSLQGVEAARALNYPFARWYLRPLAGWLAARLPATAVRPWHVTLCGLMFAIVAVILLIRQPSMSPCAALFVMAWWFCDRADGMLARLQGTASPLGAWLDGNLDELVDLGLHAAMAYAAALQGARWAWPLLVAFVFGKYLLMHSVLSLPQKVPGSSKDEPGSSIIRTLYHLPGNADVRAHLMILALATGCFTAELALIAVYYNLRWMARYPLQILRAGRQSA